MANYTHARIAFDQAIGTTLEANNIVCRRRWRDGSADLQVSACGGESHDSALPVHTLPSQMYRSGLVLHVARFVRLGAGTFDRARPPRRARSLRPYSAPEVPPVA